MYSSIDTQYVNPPKKEGETDSEPQQLPVDEKREQPWIWRNIIGLGLAHFVAIYAVIFYHRELKWQSVIFKVIWGIAAGLGITAGAHRLWSHRSYSAKLPLRVFLAIFYSMAGMDYFHVWIRDHRAHHKYVDTAADPHDASRGFFYSHVGWYLMETHPVAHKYGSKIDMSDIEADPVIRFFDKYYKLICISMTFIIPTLIPVYFWDETWLISIFTVLFRYTWVINVTFNVNSFGHMWGNRPYKKHLKPTENAVVSFFALGEGWHNYHHAFPWDYKAAELPAWTLNPTTAFIDLMAMCGLAYDLKTPSSELVEKVSLKRGDGTSSLCGKDYTSRKNTK